VHNVTVAAVPGSFIHSLIHNVTVAAVPDQQFLSVYGDPYGTPNRQAGEIHTRTVR